MHSKNMRRLAAPSGSITRLADALLHLAFPHLCAGCGTDILAKDQLLCAVCFDQLPPTSFQHHAANPVEKIFWGRLGIRYATAQYFFTKDSILQDLMHQFKYKGNRELGLAMGKAMGVQLAGTNRFREADALVPLPLHPEKEYKRGYNQAAVLCEGIASVMGIPVLRNSVVRTTHTASQTRKSRIERWQNMEGRFLVQDEAALRGKHLLLVDDVVTTGATLEACGRELLAVAGTSLSIATLCCAFN